MKDRNAMTNLPTKKQMGDMELDKEKTNNKSTEKKQSQKWEKQPNQERTSIQGRQTPKKWTK